MHGHMPGLVDCLLFVPDVGSVPDFGLADQRVRGHLPAFDLLGRGLAGLLVRGLEGFDLPGRELAGLPVRGLVGLPVGVGERRRPRVWGRLGGLLLGV